MIRILPYIPTKREPKLVLRAVISVGEMTNFNELEISDDKTAAGTISTAKAEEIYCFFKELTDRAGGDMRLDVTNLCNLWTYLNDKDGNSFEVECGRETDLVIRHKFGCTEEDVERLADICREWECLFQGHSEFDYNRLKTIEIRYIDEDGHEHECVVE